MPKAIKKMKATQPFTNLEAELNTVLLEREDEVHSLILALLSGQHVFQLGEPGVGKSLLAVEMCRRLLGSRQFEILFSRFSTPEEVFGPPSLKALRERDTYERNGSGMLQEAEVAFLDECWKANSAILNTLLPILNERLYREAGTKVTVPLISMICASNELPQGEDLGALYDRILFRHVVAPLSDSGLRRLLLDPPSNAVLATIDLTTLKAAQDKVEAVEVGAETVDSIMRLRSKLAAVKGVYVSPRRWRACLAAVKAQAWISGRTRTEDEDLLVLAHCLWADPEQRSTVEIAVIDVAAPALREIRDLLDVAVEQSSIFSSSSDENVRVEALMKLGGLAKKAFTKADKAGDPGRKISAKIVALHQEAIASRQRAEAARYGMADMFEEVE